MSSSELYKSCASFHILSSSNCIILQFIEIKSFERFNASSFIRYTPSGGSNHANTPKEV